MYACPSHKGDVFIPHLTSQKSGHAFVQRLCDVNILVCEVKSGIDPCFFELDLEQNSAKFFLSFQDHKKSTLVRKKKKEALAVSNICKNAFYQKNILGLGAL